MSLARRAWQALPRGLRREALFTAQAALAPRPDQPVPDGLGPVAVAGFLSAPTGFGEAARQLVLVLRAAGLEPLEIDLTAPLRQGEAPPPRPVPPGPGTLLVQVNAPMLPWALRVLGRDVIAGKRVIGVWNWELPAVPGDWDRGYRFVHAIWACSRFTAAALERPGGPPVWVMPNAIPAVAAAPLGRAEFGLPSDAFVALALFDASSSLARKNPLAAIAAHRLAFGERPDRVLVIKTHATAAAGAAWREVAAAAAAPNVRIIDALWDRPRVAALVAMADVFLSLHRSEGFGLGIAEAMRAGVPAIATGWSGNLDFFDPAGGIAVPFDLVPARDAQHTYDLPGTVWAEARVPAAADALRRLADDPALRLAMGNAAKRAAATLTPAALAPLARSLLAGQPPTPQGDVIDAAPQNRHIGNGGVPDRAAFGRGGDFVA